MHFSKISSVLTLASTVLAGQCYNHAEGAHKVNCVHKDELSKFADDYCHKNWNKLVGDWIDYNDRSGNTANIGKVANFSSKQACVVAFSQVVESCYNGWDGGQWVADGTLLNINFCKWSAEPKRVRYDALNARPEAPRVRYQGPREAKRVAWDGLRGDHEHTAKRVGHQGLRLQSNDL